MKQSDGSSIDERRVIQQAKEILQTLASEPVVNFVKFSRVLKQKKHLEELVKKRPIKR